MAKAGYWPAVMEETQYLMMKPHAEDWEEKKWGVVFHRHREVKATMGRHRAMLHQNQMDRCYPCQNGTAKNLQTCQILKAMGAPPPERHWQRTTHQTPPLPGTPPAPTSENDWAHRSKIDNLPPSHEYSHTPLPSLQFFSLDAYAPDIQHDIDYNPDMLTDQGTSNG